MGGPLYVETRVRADMDRVWHLTQDAAQHTRWDLRFGLIEDVPAPDGSSARAFRYSSGLGRLRVAGTGTTVGERVRPDGTRTSALRFASSHPLSPIRRGQGWWRYVPTDDGVRFLTGYDYTPSWGRPGALVDRVVVRPLMGWATAWSFDRLRLWLEDGVPPERALGRAAVDVAGRVALVAVAGAQLAAVVGAVAAAGATDAGQRRRGRTRVVVSLGAVAAATSVALAAPRLPGAPSARRCLRAPHDETGRHAPSTLRTLREPA